MRLARSLSDNFSFFAGMSRTYSTDSSSARRSRIFARPLRKSRSDLRPTSRSIGQPFSGCPFKSFDGAGFVVHAHACTVAVSEIEFSRVPVKVTLGSVLIDAAHPALEDAVVVLDGVRMDDGVVLADIFFFAVVDRFTEISLFENQLFRRAGFSLFGVALGLAFGFLLLDVGAVRPNHRLFALPE